MTYSLNWDLDSIFSGGSTSTQLQERMSQLDAQIKTYRTKVDAWQPDNASQPEELAELLSLSEKISKGFSH